MTTGHTVSAEALKLGQRWADAEVDGDREELDRLGANGFHLIGPAGFVLDRDQWLARFAPGALDMEELTWSDVTVTTFTDAASLIGIVTQKATFAGHRSDGRFRVVHSIITEDGELRFATIQYSPLAPGL
ncbi:nuclear transport factor 2 family protein [Gordonia sp. ABSL1-1]|uniref:nuclear transport factor 2 family protein n=1 Tax=Gordonia sp. ABSL1-1 TaxID=3053923 RepID=UPI00257282D1|nr:nuclear transport factor 2 family protein [Gordonia sp. ABSL1-1]MDL9938626.1 nuclear transport factor 2 family protein [Gordonia sp. ABSL1-1]